MASNPSLYRYVDFIGGNILDATNVNLLETVLQNIADGGLGAVYTPGALLNGAFVISGSSITFQSYTGGYPVYTMVNGQWENLGTSITIAGVQPTSGTANNLYLNWSQNIITSAQDPTFVDGSTGEPTIEAGQLSLQVSWTDTSGTSLNPSTQFAKNTSPIVIAIFNMSTSLISVTGINGVYPYAIATQTQAGLVQLTDTSGIAVGTNDPRLANARMPLPGSVYNSSVASLIPSGNNASSLPGWLANNNYTIGYQVIDSNGNIEVVTSLSGTGTSGGSAPGWSGTIGGQTTDNSGANQVIWTNGGTASTTQYDPATGGQGGIFTDSIIYTTLKEKLTTFLDSVNTSIQNAIAALANHIGKPLGSAETHPFPTATQVGAAPLSHVGQTLGLSTSHPAQVDADHTGFTVLRNPAVTPSSTDYSYLTTDGTNILSALTHLGDVWSSMANSQNAQGDNGAGGAANNRGTLGYMSFLAAVLAEHVNYNTHGNNNPHNLDSADIGATTTGYVDTAVANALAAAEAYTLAQIISPSITLQYVATLPGLPAILPTPSVINSGGAYSISMPSYTGAAGNYTVVSLLNSAGHGLNVAFGTGWCSNGVTIPLPAGFGSTNWVGNLSVNYADIYNQNGNESGIRGMSLVLDGTRTSQLLIINEASGTAWPYLWANWFILTWQQV